MACAVCAKIAPKVITGIAKGGATSALLSSSVKHFARSRHRLSRAGPAYGWRVERPLETWKAHTFVSVPYPFLCPTFTYV
jgi:hypothetical protein